MSKRFAIIAAALAAKGRLPARNSAEDAAVLRLAVQPPPRKELSIEERSRLGYAELDSGVPEKERAYSAL